MEIILGAALIGLGFVCGVALMSVLFIRRESDDGWYEEHMEGDVHHVEVTKIPKTLFD